MVEQGWTKTEVYLKDLQAHSEPVRLTIRQGLSLLRAAVQRRSLHPDQRRQSALSRLQDADHNPDARALERDHSADPTPCCTSLHIIGGQLFALYEQNAHSLLRRFDTDGKPLGEIELPTLGTISDLGGEYDSTSAFYLFSSFTVPTTIYRFDIRAAKSTLWDSVKTGIDTSQYETKQVWYTSKDGTRVSDVPGDAQGTEARPATPRCC